MKAASNPYFEILAPRAWTVPMVLNSPHSGSYLPPAFVDQARLSCQDLRRSEDCFVDELFNCCVELGAPMLRALVSRSFVDLNREPYEFDQRLFAERLPSHMNLASPRVASGLGTIPRIVGDGMPIYGGPLPLSEALARIETVYRPYHRSLAALLDEAHRAAGIVLLIDCHSMPSSAVAHLDGFGHRKPDVILGDRFGASCDGELVALAEDILESHGLRVLRNRPYAGGFSTECHGFPRHGRHALQIEVNRSLYMNEEQQTKTSGFAALQQVLNEVLKGLSQRLEAYAAPTILPQAAE